MVWSNGVISNTVIDKTKKFEFEFNESSFGDLKAAVPVTDPGRYCLRNKSSPNLALDLSAFSDCGPMDVE